MYIEDIGLGEVNLLFGIDNSFDTKLDRALAALIDANANNDVSAINALKANTALANEAAHGVRADLRAFA